MLTKKKITERKMKTSRRFSLLIAVAVLFACALPTGASAVGVADDTADVRQSVRRAFDQLRAGQYSELYDTLSSSSRERITRRAFIRSMEGTRDIYELDRIEIGRVRVRGNRATVSTTIYGRVLKPTAGEGKIVAQQTLVREGGEWRVATGSPSAGLSSTSPRIYVRRDGRWVDVTNAVRASTRRRN